jgi:D-tyrosyl-tRNA(Tyr) deacylase
VKVVLQRVSWASVAVGEEVVGSIGPGLLLLVGMAAEDDEGAMRVMASKIVNLRIFDDAEGRMNLSLLETDGALLAVSQFTLFADCRKGRRPSYAGAAPPDQARGAFEGFVRVLRESGVAVETGRFQAMMQVSLVNDGPVTILLDSRELGGK